jgi:hypothetical protein
MQIYFNVILTPGFTDALPRSQRLRLAREQTTPPARTNGTRAILLDKILSQPRPCHCQAPAGTRAARTLPRPSDSDWPGANYATGLHITSPGGLDHPDQMLYPGKAVSYLIHHPRSPANPRPATARPGGARAARTLPRAGAPD